jgi:hypothetical protein
MHHKQLVAAAVEFPLTLQSLERKVDALCSQVAFLVKQNERLVETLSKLFDLEEGHVDTRGKTGDGCKGYVS